MADRKEWLKDSVQEAIKREIDRYRAELNTSAGKLLGLFDWEAQMDCLPKGALINAEFAGERPGGVAFQWQYSYPNGAEKPRAALLIVLGIHE